MLEVTVLAVPDCPNEPVLRDRLAQVLPDYPDATVTRKVIQDEARAARHGTARLAYFAGQRVRPVRCAWHACQPLLPPVPRSGRAARGRPAGCGAA